MTKDGALPKGFESPSDLGSQEKYEEVKSSSKTKLTNRLLLLLK